MGKSVEPFQFRMTEPVSDMACTPRKNRLAKVDKAALDESPSPGVGSSPTSIFADSGHAKRASMSKLALLAVSCFTHYNYFQKNFLIF